MKKGDVLFERPTLLRRLTVLNDAGETHMRMVHDRCIALEGPIGRRVSCAIYEVRPSPCRRVEAGSEQCLARRSERDIRD